MVPWELPEDAGRLGPSEQRVLPGTVAVPLAQWRLGHLGGPEVEPVFPKEVRMAQEKPGPERQRSFSGKDPSGPVAISPGQWPTSPLAAAGEPKAAESELLLFLGKLSALRRSPDSQGKWLHVAVSTLHLGAPAG